MFIREVFLLGYECRALINQYLDLSFFAFQPLLIEFIALFRGIRRSTPNLIQNAGNVVGLLTAIPIIWTFYEVIFGRKKRHKKWFNEARADTGSRPGILLIDLLSNKEIRSSMEKFRDKHEKLKAINEDRIFTITRDKHIKPEDVPDIYRELSNRSSEIMHAGIDSLHIFLAGPLFAASIIGAEFSNAGFRIHLYQNDTISNTYIDFGPLRHPI